MKILLVKTSSLGDVIHNLPVASDIHAFRPGSRVDWVVEEQYVPLVAMHPGVSRVIPVALRRWRRALFSGVTWREFGAFRRDLGSQEYDAIVETQGLLKSALLAKLARGPIYGYGPMTAREPLASRFYDVTSEFSPETHKIARCRSVAARAVGYSIAGPIDYGIAPRVPRPALGAASYWLAFHSTARAAKLWQESSWLELVRQLASAGHTCVLPWGSDEERARSERIAAPGTAAIVPPGFTLDELSALVAGADLVVGVDTGLMHLAAALARPVVGVFCDSNPVDACPVGTGPTAYRGHIGKPPAVEAVVEAIREVVPGYL